MMKKGMLKKVYERHFGARNDEKGFFSYGEPPMRKKVFHILKRKTLRIFILILEKLFIIIPDDDTSVSKA